jgi:hypothetical protein
VFTLAKFSATTQTILPIDIAPSLLTLANRNNRIRVTPPKVAKASTVVTFARHSVPDSFALQNFANVNDPFISVLLTLRSKFIIFVKKN